MLDWAKLCTLEITPGRVMNVPKTDSWNEPVIRPRFRFFSMPRFSWIITPLHYEIGRSQRLEILPESRHASFELAHLLVHGGQSLTQRGRQRLGGIGQQRRQLAQGPRGSGRENDALFAQDAAQHVEPRGAGCHPLVTDAVAGLLPRPASVLSGAAGLHHDVRGFQGAQQVGKLRSVEAVVLQHPPATLARAHSPALSSR
ncbi:MAG TPA: hypothetical protein VNL96_09530 [Gemmatimonadaceae bacterium]|nr:hypothetical protein [Gemmatimonadaceae bacterium]